MGFSGDSAADLQRDMRAFLEGDLQTDPCGDSQSHLPAGSCRDSKTDSRRDLQRDFPRGFDGDFDGALPVTTEGRIGGRQRVTICQVGVGSDEAGELAAKAAESVAGDEV
jgi:hypothetical protein